MSSHAAPQGRCHVRPDGASANRLTAGASVFRRTPAIDSAMGTSGARGSPQSSSAQPPRVSEELPRLDRDFSGIAVHGRALRGPSRNEASGRPDRRNASAPAAAGNQMDAGAPVADAGPPPGGAPAAPAQQPPPVPAQQPPPVASSATIGPVEFNGAFHRVPPGRRAGVTVDLSGLPSGSTVAIDIEGSGGANGTAVALASSLSGSSSVIIEGGTQTAPGNAGNLRVRASMGGTALGRSPGFTVAAWPRDFTISRHSDVNTSGVVGLFVNIGCVSDSASGSLTDLNEAEHTEIVDIQSRDNPPFTSAAGTSTTSGTSGLMPATSTGLIDRHRYGRANIVTAGTAAGTYRIVYGQNFLFNDRRTGTIGAVVPNSGFTIVHEVWFFAGTGTWKHKTAKQGAAVTVASRPSTAGSGTGESDEHNL